MNKLREFADHVGMTASVLCLLHCLAMPLLLTLFPFLGFVHQDNFLHRWMAVVVPLPVLLALIPGYVVHRQWRVIALGGCGLACFTTAVLFIGPQYGEAAETVLAVTGGTLLFGAHFQNRIFCKRCVLSSDDNFPSENKCSHAVRKVKGH